MKKKFIKILIFLFSLTFLYILYKSGIFFNKYIEYDFKFYITINLIIISILSVSLFFYKFQEYLLIILISSFIGLYFSEIFFIFNNVNNKNFKKNLYYKNTNKLFDERTKLELYFKINEDKKKIFYLTGPEFVKQNKSEVEKYFISGISNVNSLQCNENGYYSIIKNDRFGFNNPDIEWSQKKISYLLLGDSFIHGACVNRPKDISSNIRILSKKTVINLGYSGIGPLSKLAILREYIQPNTEKILWFHYEGNDFEDLHSELNNKTLVEYFDKNYIQNLRNFHYLIDNYHDDYKFEKLRVDARNIEIDHDKIFFRVLSLIKLSETRKIILRNTTPKTKEFREFKEFKKIINLAKIQSEKNNSKLYFIYLPSYSRYKNKVDNTNYENVQKIISDLDIEFIDIHKEVFINEENPLKLFPFGLPGHYNEIGNKKISEKIFNLLN